MRACWALVPLECLDSVWDVAFEVFFSLWPRYQQTSMVFSLRVYSLAVRINTSHCFMDPCWSTIFGDGILDHYYFTLFKPSGPNISVIYLEDRFGFNFRRSPFLARKLV